MVVPLSACGKLRFGGNTDPIDYTHTKDFLHNVARQINKNWVQEKILIKGHSMSNQHKKKSLPPPI